MQSEKLSSITIVGGGSSGWMTALYLNRLYNANEKTVNITLIESPNVPTIGVGEATVHSIRYFFAAMGLDEEELLRETNATLKTGIMFANWMKPDASGKQHEYFHSFEQQNLGNIVDISSAWMLENRHQVERYDEGVSLSAHLIKTRLSPKAQQSRPYEGIVPYGYHLDAIKMANYFCKIATKAGVNHIQATVEDVTVENGNIQSVITDKGAFTADVFIDCTGFKGLLIEKLKDDNWQSFTDALPCDKAVAIQVDYPDTEQPKSYTLATALANGWVWEIDLVNRRGTGYVYDSSRISKEEAEQELLAHLGEDVKVRRVVHLDMKVGCRKEFWVGNCISVGLSGGFIEPLESTGLHLINAGVRLIGTHLTGRETDQSVRDAYNRLMNGIFGDLKQFIVLHYCLSDRDDSEFWREVSKSSQYCPGLDAKIEAWRHKVCEFMDLAGGYISMFSDENYRSILYGMKHFPKLNIASSSEENQKIFAEFNHRVDRVMMASVPHAQYLASLQKEEA